MQKDVHRAAGNSPWVNPLLSLAAPGMARRNIYMKMKLFLMRRLDRFSKGAVMNPAKNAEILVSKLLGWFLTVWAAKIAIFCHID